MMNLVMTKQHHAMNFERLNVADEIKEIQVIPTIEATNSRTIKAFLFYVNIKLSEE